MKRVKLKSVLTTGQVAEIIGVTSTMVARWCDQGRLQSFRVPFSSHRRIQADELRKFMVRNKMPVDLLLKGQLVA